MNTSRILGMLAGIVTIAVSLASAADAPIPASKDKYGVKVPGGLAFSEFRGFESWETISVSSNDKAVAVILGNPAMIAAFKAGFPANGKPAPDGAKMAKIHWLRPRTSSFPTRPSPGLSRMSTS